MQIILAWHTYNRIGMWSKLVVYSKYIKLSSLQFSTTFLQWLIKKSFISLFICHVVGSLLTLATQQMKNLINKCEEIYYSQPLFPADISAVTLRKISMPTHYCPCGSHAACTSLPGDADTASPLYRQLHQHNCSFYRHNKIKWQTIVKHIQCISYIANYKLYYSTNLELRGSSKPQVKNRIF